MEVLYFIVLLMLVGGALTALGIWSVPRRRSDPIAAALAERTPMEPPAINYSRLKVSGVGGFGLVLLCVAVAAELPAVRRSMLTALVLGAVMAATLVWLRHKHPLPSSDASPGASTTLRIDE